MTVRRLLLAVAAGLALADASVVTLALPELLTDLDTTVQGVASVIGVYTVALAAALLPAERLARAQGAGRVGAAGFALFALASLGCAAAGSLLVLDLFRVLQAVGGAAGLVAAFVLLIGTTAPGDGHASARSLWLGAAVFSAAVGPALGGLLTELFAWQSIFLVQAPIALAAAWTCATAGRGDVPVATGAPERSWRAGAALAAVSAALTAVLFLLVLLLVAGWAISPLEAAVTVTVLPLAALAGSRIGGDARLRAAVGCSLVGAGTIALAALPDAQLGWTVAPQVLAGLGMGLALPALGGELLPERDARDAAWLLTMRHAGIALALVVLAPITADRLEQATLDARQQGVALVLDAPLSPGEKVTLAPALLAGVKDERPRAGLATALDEQRADFDSGPQAAVYAELAERSDDVLVNAVGESFLAAFLITGAVALLGTALLLPIPWPPTWAFAAALAATVVVVGTFVAQDRSKPAPVVIADPCLTRELPGADGLTGALQDAALVAIDKRACALGATREEVVLAVADAEDRARFEQKYGESPVTVTGVLDALLGG